MSGKTSIVILGAGGAGVTTAQALDKTLDPSKHRLTIVSEADYFRHLPASLRAVVTAEGEIEKGMLIPFDRLFGKATKDGKGRVGTLVVEKVVGIEENAGGEGGHVLFEGGSRLEWDYLVVATGSRWAAPLTWPAKLDDVPKFLDGWREKFASAKSIVLAGAGAVGSELAGEIRDFIPGAEVTVVQRDGLLLNATYPDSFRRRVASDLAARGVKIITDDTVPNLPAGVLDGSEGVVAGRKITTSKGVTVPAELIIPTGGRIGVNTSFIASSASSAPTISKALASNGHLEVKATLQLETNPRVFAAGDVVALNEQHTLMKASSHAAVVSSNILALVQQQGKALSNYSKPPDMILITNGRRGGSAFLGSIFGFNIILGAWFASMIKSKGLLVGMARGALNQ